MKILALFICLVSPFQVRALTPITDGNIRRAANLWNSNPTQAESTYGHISEWDTSRVTSLRSVFEGSYFNPNPFNGDISKWSTSAVTDMSNCFRYATTFNANIGRWDTSRVSTLFATFSYADAFNADIGRWNTSRVSDMYSTFDSAEAFSTDISRWDVSRVTRSITRNFCSAGKYGRVAAWGTQCTACASGEFKDKHGETTGCEKCLPGLYSEPASSHCYAICPARQYPVKVGPNYTCQNCSHGTYNNASGKPFCTQCPRGWYGDEMALDVCKACANGKYSAMVGSTECMECPRGWFSNRSGLSVCSECAPGFFSELTMSLSCEHCPRGSFARRSAEYACADCPKGFYQDDNAGALCMKCEAGYFADLNGTFRCKACVAGKYNSQKASVHSTACISCSRGRFSNRSGGVSNGTCGACTPGYYSQPASVKCHECPLGYFAERTLSHNCTACPEGFDRHDKVGDACSRCKAGFYAQGTNTSRCNECPRGYYNLDDTQTSCIACEKGKYNPGVSLNRKCFDCPRLKQTASYNCPVCEPGKFETVNRTCSICPQGFHQKTPDSKQCDACPTGRIAIDPESAQCIKCEPGMYGFNATHCAECPAGRFSAILGAPSLSNCSLCSNGSYCEEGAIFERPCPPTVYGNVSGLGTKNCSGPCPSGYACVAQTLQPIKCSFGTYSDPAQSACVGCPKGWHAPTIASAKCSRCQPGRISADRAASCQVCTPGLYSNLSRTSCDACPRGYFSNKEGSTNCTQCGTGQGTLTEGSRSCIKAEPSKNITILRVEQEAPFASVRVEWVETADVITRSVRLFEGSQEADDMPSKASMQQEKAKGMWTGSISNLKFGLKYYFFVSGKTATGKDATSFLSDPETIECPALACCGTENDRAERCKFNLTNKGALRHELAAEMFAYHVGQVTFESCPNAEACLGGARSACADGYGGMLCHGCATGYARRGDHECGTCDEWSTVYTVVAVTVFSAICVYFIKSTLSKSEKTLELEMGKIALSGSQAITVLGRYPLKWPHGARAMFNFAGGIFSGASEVISFTCTMDNDHGSRYFRGSAVILAAPLVIVSVTGIFWYIMAAREPEKAKRIRSNFVVSVMIIVFMVLPSLNQTVFKLFSCQTIGDDNFSVARAAGDLDIDCIGVTHVAYMVGVGAPAFLLYSLGMPSTAILLLQRLRKRKKLAVPREVSYSSNVYGFLYAGYKREQYFWEVVIMLRKVMLNLILVLMASASALAQGVMVNLVLVIFILLHMHNQPYEENILNRIELGSLMLAAAVLQFGFLLFDDDMGDGAKAALTVSMVTLIIRCIVAFLTILCCQVRKTRSASIRDGMEKARGGMLKAREKAAHTINAGVEMVERRMRNVSRGRQQSEGAVAVANPLPRQHAI
eukprot:g5350.t1